MRDVAVPGESQRLAKPPEAATRARGWALWGHPPAIVGAPGRGGIRWPVPGTGRAVEGGCLAHQAALGWLVQAVLQPQAEPGDLLLQLADGLAGVGRQKQRTDAHSPECCQDALVFVPSHQALGPALLAIDPGTCSVSTFLAIYPPF